jgi:hypothetical protein
VSEVDLDSCSSALLRHRIAVQLSGEPPQHAHPPMRSMHCFRSLRMLVMLSVHCCRASWVVACLRVSFKKSMSPSRRSSRCRSQAGSMPP